MTDEMVAQRSKARGVSPQEYMRGNLVHREVLAEDVAAALSISPRPGRAPARF